MKPQSTKDKILASDRVMSHLLSNHALTEDDIKAMDINAISELIEKLNGDVNPEGNTNE